VQDHVHIAALFTQNMCVQALSMTRASLWIKIVGG
jgi:hypothetical protein